MVKCMQCSFATCHTHPCPCEHHLPPSRHPCPHYQCHPYPCHRPTLYSQCHWWSPALFTALSGNGNPPTPPPTSHATQCTCKAPPPHCTCSKLEICIYIYLIHFYLNFIPPTCSCLSAAPTAHKTTGVVCTDGDRGSPTQWQVQVQPYSSPMQMTGTGCGLGPNQTRQSCPQP